MSGVYGWKQAGSGQGRFYVGAGGAQAPPNVGQAPPNIFGSNSKDTHSLTHCCT